MSGKTTADKLDPLHVFHQKEGGDVASDEAHVESDNAKTPPKEGKSTADKLDPLNVFHKKDAEEPGSSMKSAHVESDEAKKLPKEGKSTADKLDPLNVFHKKDAEEPGASKKPTTPSKSTADTLDPLGVFHKTGEAKAPPTSLWQHCKDKEWDFVAEDLADTEAAASMAQVWHGKDLPLHVACRNQAPSSVIISLVDLYPAAVKERSKKDNRLPLTLCVNHKGSYDSVGKIIRAWPDALDARNDDKNPLATETIRSNLGVRSGISASVKKALQRSTEDWKVVMDWEREQHEHKENIATLKEDLEGTQAELLTAEAVSAKHGKQLKWLDKKQKAFDSSTSAKFEELEKALESLKTLQKSNYAELKGDVNATIARDIVTRSAFNGYTDDLLKAFEKQTKEIEILREELAKIKGSGSD